MDVDAPQSIALLTDDAGHRELAAGALEARLSPDARIVTGQRGQRPLLRPRVEALHASYSEHDPQVRTAMLGISIADLAFADLLVGNDDGPQWTGVSRKNRPRRLGQALPGVPIGVTVRSTASRDWGSGSPSHRTCNNLGRQVGAALGLILATCSRRRGCTETSGPSAVRRRLPAASPPCGAVRQRPTGRKTTAVALPLESTPKGVITSTGTSVAAGRSNLSATVVTERPLPLIRPPQGSCGPLLAVQLLPALVP